VNRLRPNSGDLRDGSRLAAVAASQPERMIAADDLGRPFGKDGEWVSSRTGIQSLRRLAVAEPLLPHAADAAAKALAQAALTPDAVDLLITATCSANVRPDSAFADSLRGELGLSGAHLDLNAACAGFSYALSMADAQIRSGVVETVLVVAAERMSGLVDGADLGTSILFGDGAGAVVVVPSSEPQIGPTAWGSDGAQTHVLTMDSAGFLRMKGSEVFRWAVQIVPPIAREACQRAGVRPEDIDVFVPHQANLRIIDAAIERVGLRDDVVVATDVIESGNTSAASIPIALSKLRDRGQFESGAKALLVGYGAGLAYSAQVVVLP
jgi:3-oxoacyl-[acyl-carrier-protein] synthase-3